MMPKITSFPVLVAVSALVALATPTHADVFVSTVGVDTNTCTRTAPCRTFERAHAVAASGDTIFCIDPGSYFATSIQKSITIDCSAVSAAAFRADFAPVFSIAVPGIHVTIRGLNIRGLGNINAIDFVDGASLRVERCTIQEIVSGQPTISSAGIRFIPAQGAAQLFVSDTIISRVGDNTLGGSAILVAPRAGSALVTLERVQLNGNFEGLRATGASGGAVFVSIQDSIASINSSYGFIAVNPVGGKPVTMDIQRSSSTLNGGAGIRASGPGVRVFVGSSSVTANTTGYSPANGGIIFSYGNNAVDSNSDDGLANGSTALR